MADLVSRDGMFLLCLSALDAAAVQSLPESREGLGVVHLAELKVVLQNQCESVGE